MDIIARHNRAHIRATRIVSRAKFITKIADEFEASGVAYTCGKVVLEFAAPHVAVFRHTSEFADHATFKQWSLEKAVWDEVHRRWTAARK